MSGVQQAVFQNQRSFGTGAGSASYTAIGNYTWVAPAGVTSVSAVIVSSGGTTCQGTSKGKQYGSGGGGGALGWRNNISVIPGKGYCVTLSATSNCTSTRSSFICNTVSTPGLVVVSARSLYGGTSLGCVVGQITSPGGNSAYSSCDRSGGGGAGGYSSSYQGGAGYWHVYFCCPCAGPICCGAPATAGGRGGGGGGNAAQGGGGVGLYGEGCSGAAGGYGGSGGTNGVTNAGGVYGGGGAGTGNGVGGSPGGPALRIVWPGTTRKFPSTCVGAP